MQSKEIKIFTPEENLCLSRKLAYPKLTIRTLSKIHFDISKKELTGLLKRITNGYGTIVELNKIFNITLQYHGRFKSFLIGIGINDENPNQPDFKLLRIDTIVESTHNGTNATFLGATKIEGPHFHWYNGVYVMFLSQKIFDLSNPDEGIIKFLLEKKKNLNLNKNIIKEALPYEEFIKLCELFIEKKHLMRDEYITTNEKLQTNPKVVLNQILKREVF